MGVSEQSEPSSHMRAGGLRVVGGEGRGRGLWDLEGGPRSCPGRVGQALLEEVTAMAACERGAGRSWRRRGGGRWESRRQQVRAEGTVWTAREARCAWCGRGWACHVMGREEGRAVV